MKQLETLREVNILTTGGQLTNKNVKLLAKVLEVLPRVSSATLGVMGPIITRYYLRLNKISYLTLELTLSLQSFSFGRISLIKRLKIPISVSFQDIDSHKMYSPSQLTSLFKNYSKASQLKSLSYTEDPQTQLDFASKNNMVSNLNKLVVNNTPFLRTLSVSFSDSLLLEFFLNAIQTNIKMFQGLQAFNFNVFEYSEFPPLEESLINFLNSLQLLPSLSELYFSIDGELDAKFSLSYLDFMAKCKHIKSLGFFSLKLEAEDLKKVLTKLTKIKTLESLVAWILPSSQDSFDEYFTCNQTDINQSIVESVNSLPGLQKICFRLPISNHIGRSM